METLRRVRKPVSVRREEILDEAIRQIGRLGYRGFTIRELSSACGMSNAGMLHYFASKAELLAAVVDRLEERQTRLLRPRIEAASSDAGREEVVALLVEIMRSALKEREEVRLVAMLQAEAIDPSHPAYASFRRREADAIAFLEHAIAPIVSEPVALARGLHAAMSGFAQQWLREDEGFDVVGAWTVVVEQMLAK